jgi:hypothetical protein
VLTGTIIGDSTDFDVVEKQNDMDMEADITTARWDVEKSQRSRPEGRKRASTVNIRDAQPHPSVQRAETMKGQGVPPNLRRITSQPPVGEWDGTGACVN